MRKTGRKSAWIMAFILLVSVVLQGTPVQATEQNDDIAFTSENDDSINDYPYYRDILSEYKKEYQTYNGTDIVFDAVNCAISLEGFATEYEQDGVLYEGVLWNQEQKVLELEVLAPESALYQISVEYAQPEGYGADITRKVYLDGSPIFREAFTVSFPRFWKYDKPLVNTQGDEVKPFANEVPRIATVTLTDSQGKENTGFQYYLTEGKHVIKFEYLAEPIFITKIILTQPKEIISYDELQKSYVVEQKTTQGKNLCFEAEDSTYVKELTDSVIGPQSNGDPATYPASIKNVKMNYIGGANYNSGNQTITWNFDVEQDGLYQLGFRVYRNYKNGLPCYYQIAIDGEVPCKELEAYEFAYSKKWYTEVLGNNESEPYLFWLEEGTHTISFTIKLDFYGEMIDRLTDWTKEYSAMIRKIKMFTGEDPDPNYDYELTKNIPNLQKNLQQLSDSLNHEVQMLIQAAGKSTPISNGIESIVVQTNELIEKPDRIPKRLSDMETALGSVSSYITSLKSNSIGIDKIWVYNSESDVPELKSTFWARMKGFFTNFFAAFVKNYNGVSSVEGTVKADRTIEIWVGRGKEWAEVIKQLADSYFTPEHGVNVEINVVPASQMSSNGLNGLTMAMGSNTEPDIVLGMGTSMVAEYAMRNSLLDISQFDDFNEIKERFYAETFVPIEYDGKYYALPETVNFRAVFYRTDIFKELGLEVPDTWEELYNTTLPVLYRNNLECYIPMLYDVFLFQNGGSYYTEDRCHTGLDSIEGYQAFQELCELYINYDIPVSMNFFNRFRTGEVAIGIGEFATYSTLVSAASELEGSWALAPMLGTIQKDGTMSRASAGFSVDAAAIVSTTEEKEASWEFLKWWTSDEVQARFCRLIESNMGITARYNSANIYANNTLGYSTEDRAVIDNFYENAETSPVAVGGNYTGRYITNAWNSVVVNGEPMRDVFEEAMEAIEKELKQSRERLGIHVD